MDRRADALDFGLARTNPFLHRAGTGMAVADHGGGQPAFGVADRIEGAIERQSIEIVGHDDIRHRIGDAIELEECLGRKIGRGHFGHRLAGAIRHQRDIGRGLEYGKTADAARQRIGYAGVDKLRHARVTRIRRRLRQGTVECGCDLRDAFAVVSDDLLEPLREIHVAQKPDHPVE